MDPYSLSTMGTNLEFGGSLFNSFAHFINGAQQAQAGDFRAAQLRQQASDAMASAQRRAFSEDRNSRVIQSNALASAAASGGGASDPTVINIIATDAAEGAYRKAVAVYQGEDKSRNLNLQADTAVYSGKVAKMQGYMSGVTSGIGAYTSLLKGQARDASIYQRFGNGGPKGLTDPWAEKGPGEG